ncbi:MAG: ABC transporter permease subunit [Thermodesulfovibrionales bacterium]|nr:ABC transporter permease subunit [Thermodesulfovibrionales bacterium]
MSPLNIKRTKNLSLLFLSIIILFLSFKISNVDIPTLLNGLSYSLALIREMIPPDFSRWQKILLLSIETIAIGFWGTLLDAIISLPLGFFSAKNTSIDVLSSLSKGFVSLLRAIPDIMYAVIFVTSIGIGPLAGVLALVFHTAGILSKFFAEAIESIDRKPVEAIEATGSHRLGVVRYAILP